VRRTLSQASLQRRLSRHLFPSSSSSCLPVSAATTTRNFLNRNSLHVRYSSNQITPTTTTGSSSSSLAKTSSDGVVGLPIDFDVASKIEGSESQIVTIALEPGQVLRAESGAMMYMTDGVQMETTSGGGLSAGFSRMLTGQNFFISDYRYDGPVGTTGTVALGTDFPSKIVRLNVAEYGGKLICQKGALLCASHTIDINMEYSKNFTTGFFGGEGFILQVCSSSCFGSRK
jgi:Mitochondrial biogenesis AIM24